MHILHVYKDYFPVLGGIENHIKWQAEGMQARGHRVHVLVTNTARRTLRQRIQGVPVTKTGRQFNVSSAPVSLGLFQELARLGQDADIVHLHAPYPPGELAQLLVRAGRHTVITYHSDIVKQATLLRFYAPFLHRILDRAHAILVSNPRYPQGSPFLRPRQDKIRVVHFGIDPTRFQPTEASLRRAQELRRRFGPAPLALFVGRLRYYKGVDVLIQALALTPEVQGVIVGTGPMEGAARALVHQLGLAERVYFAGHVADADLPAFYQAGDLFVLPSIHRSESLGIVLLEAMASGLPVISTELGTGTSYVNQNNVTGLVVPPRDPAALAQALRRLARHPEQRAALGQAARQRIQEAFSLEQMLDQTERVYREILGESPARGSGQNML